MKKYLISEKGQFYKANLHSHSTCSDGSLTPEELKNLYKSHGYSVFAFTDHEILIDHSDLNDENFLAITGYEMGIWDEIVGSKKNTKCTHINLISKTPHNNRQVCFHPDDIIFESSKPFISGMVCNEEPFVKTHTAECIRHIIEEANKNGFMVAYNHPTWSLEDFEDFSQYGDFYAMEIHNSGCVTAAGIDENNIKAYDQMLRSGRRIYALATDDNHNHFPLDTVMSDSFGGWVMIKSEALEYGKIIEALENGQFYSSQGPEIYDLYYEDGFVYVKCSPASIIRLNTGGRRTSIAYTKKGETITEAKLEINEFDKYFRITVTDLNGKNAYTNAYFLDQL